MSRETKEFISQKEARIVKAARDQSTRDKGFKIARDTENNDRSFRKFRGSDFSLDELFSTIKERVSSGDTNSYSSQLITAGLEKITRKIGEEATEVIIASFLNEQRKTAKSKNDLVREVCDLLYHSLVLLVSQDIDFSAVINELSERNQKNNQSDKYARAPQDQGRQGFGSKFQPREFQQDRRDPSSFNGKFSANKSNKFGTKSNFRSKTKRK